MQKSYSQGDRRLLPRIAASHAACSDSGRSRASTPVRPCRATRCGARALTRSWKSAPVCSSVRPIAVGRRDDFAGFVGGEQRDQPRELRGDSDEGGCHEEFRPALIIAARASSRVGKTPSGMPSTPHARQKRSTAAKWPRWAAVINGDYLLLFGGGWALSTRRSACCSARSFPRRPAADTAGLWRSMAGHGS